MKEKKVQLILVGVAIVLLAGGVIWRIESLHPSEQASVPSTTLPPPPDPNIIGKVVHDSATGKDFMNNEMIVEFNTDVSEETALSIIASVNAVMEQRFTAVPLFLVRIDDPGDGSVTRAAMKKLSADTRVKRVDLNFLTTKQ